MYLWNMQKLFILAALALFVPACVGTTSTLQTAPTLGKGNVQVAAGMSIPVSTRFVGEVADAVTEVNDRVKNSDTSPLSRDEQREVMQTTLGVLLFQPALLTIFDLRYGVAEKVDLGLKLAGAATRLEGKYWLQHQEGGLDVALNLGLTRHSEIGSSVAKKGFDFLESVDLAAFKRRDIDGAILLSSDAKKKWGFYGAIRYLAAFVKAETSFSKVLTQEDITEIDVDETMHHYGGTAGVRATLGPVQLMVELTIMRLAFSPTILDEEVQLGGYIVEPAAGLSVSF